MRGTYDPPLVVLSIIVAIFASFVALDLSSRLAVIDRSTRGRWMWLMGGALSMGLGIWSMHFIGMLAFRSAMHVSYDIWITVLSLIIAIVASGISLTMAWRNKLEPTWLATAGTLLGLGIAGMHYTGMAAMKMYPPPHFNFPLVGLSVLIAVLGSLLGIWTAFTLRYEPFFAAFWKRVGSAVITGSAICGMHYVGMAAEEYEPLCVSAVKQFQHFDRTSLAYILGIVILSFLMATLLISAFDAYQISQSSTEARSLHEMNESIARQAKELTVFNRRLKREIKMRERAEESLKRASDNLARSNASLEQFAYVASHDLQEPVRMVQSYLTLLERESEGKLDARSGEFLTIAKDGADRMKRLIRDLLLYAKVGAERPRPSTVDMNSVLNTTVRLLKPAIEESGAEIIPDPLPVVLGDRLQLERLLQNLLANAVHYRKPGVKPLIKVTGQRRNEDWLFCVRDNGLGFEMEHAVTIFGEFRRLHGSHSGSGLGLAISEKIVKQHGGRIWAEAAPSKGASFYFTLPLEKPEASFRDDRSYIVDKT